MPYTLKGNSVVRKDTGEVVKTHPTKAKALAHLRALKANVEAQEAQWRALDERAEGWLPSARQLQESAKTAALSVTPSPFSTSTTSNWVARVGGLPAYIQNVAKGIMKSGKSESTAIASAIAVMKRWASGVGHVSPEVRAAAAKALAEWEAKRAASRAKSAVKKVASAVSGGGGSKETQEAAWEEALHPRGRGGKWVDVLDKLTAEIGIDNSGRLNLKPGDVFQMGKNRYLVQNGARLTGAPSAASTRHEVDVITPGGRARTLQIHPNQVSKLRRLSEASWSELEPRGWHGRWVGHTLHVSHNDKSITTVTASGHGLDRWDLIQQVHGAVGVRQGRPPISLADAQRVVDLATGTPPKRRPSSGDRPFGVEGESTLYSSLLPGGGPK